MSKIIQFIQFFSPLKKGLRIEPCSLSSSKKGWANDCPGRLPALQPAHAQSRPLVKSLPKVKNVCDAGQANDDSTVTMNKGSNVDVDCVLRFGRAIWVCTRPRRINGWTR